jgi:hypothetical protein
VKTIKDISEHHINGLLHLVIRCTTLSPKVSDKSDFQAHSVIKPQIAQSHQEISFVFRKLFSQIQMILYSEEIHSSGRNFLQF